MNRRARSKMRIVRVSLYQLKQEYGIPAALYKMSIGTTDRETGQKTVGRTKVPLSRFIVLPARTLNKFEYDLTYIGANKNFTYGGFFEVGDREAVIDANDLPRNYEMDQNDYVVFNGDRYNIIEFWELDFKQGFHLHLRRTQKENTYQLIDVYVAQRAYVVQQFVGAK